MVFLFILMGSFIFVLTIDGIGITGTLLKILLGVGLLAYSYREKRRNRKAADYHGPAAFPLLQFRFSAYFPGSVPRPPVSKMYVKKDWILSTWFSIL